MSRKWGKMSNWPTISARVDPDVKDKLQKKFPNEGDISKLVRALLTKYVDGKIFGVQLEQ